MPIPTRRFLSDSHSFFEDLAERSISLCLEKGTFELCFSFPSGASSIRLNRQRLLPFSRHFVCRYLLVSSSNLSASESF